ncbi:MAG: hypothetical protein KDA60_16490, partial [Planctomycetales bacterium]|nr:hypothetical protein [Planctomycetales bacterium]
MSYELVISPAGRLSVQSTGVESSGNAQRTARRKDADLLANLTQAFRQGNGPGLFQLAAAPSEEKSDATQSPSVQYWRKFGIRFIEQVCLALVDATDGSNSVPSPSDAELASLVLNVPPMRGAEYVSRDLLSHLWHDVDDWFKQELHESKQSVSEFLEQRYPSWHQVGRVCFHLAENRRDRDYPFAFLATYAPSGFENTNKNARYQPLSQALRQYAGNKNKHALVKLLSPIQATAESNAFLRELTESGDIYEPLAWSPPEAYEFLKAVPLMEEHGITVRLPDWWKKRPRPRVGVTIGEAKQKTLDVNALLDFRIQVVLGEEELSPDEIRSLLNGDDGLVMLKGRWVEVDRDRLQQALDHWKTVERDAVDGISFRDGMRLLAGAPADLGETSLDPGQQDWAFVDAGAWLGQLLSDMRSPQQLDLARPGKALKATLRHYQVTGVNWLTYLSNLGLGACLADDMGLGKTIQVVSLLLILKRQAVTNPSLLVLPASLLGNWKAEFEKFAPTLSARFVHSSVTTKGEIAAIAKDPAKAFATADVVVTT